MKLDDLNKVDVNTLFIEAKKYGEYWNEIEESINNFIRICYAILGEFNEQTYLDSGGKYRGKAYFELYDMNELIRKEIGLLLEKLYEKRQ